MNLLSHCPSKATKELPIFSMGPTCRHSGNQEYLQRLQSIHDHLPSHAANTIQWLYVPYDQLHLQLAPLNQKDAHQQWGLIFIESTTWNRIRPYHKQRLAWIYAQQRMFAWEAMQAGFQVRYHIQAAQIDEILNSELCQNDLIFIRTPAERSLRVCLHDLLQQHKLSVLPHTGWLSTREDFLTAMGDTPPWKQDKFYRYMRKKTGILMQNKKPVGGQWSLDAENRKPWHGEPSAPLFPTWTTTNDHHITHLIKVELEAWLNEAYSDHPGTINMDVIPVSIQQVQSMWSWVLEQCMTYFGPYEDAMHTQADHLFHTQISPLLNLYRILPQQVIDDVLSLEIPLNSKEGFIRQVLGWREFVYHIHVESEGLRKGLYQEILVEDRVGNAGYHRWYQQQYDQNYQASNHRVEDGGAACNYLQAHYDLPLAYWGQESGLHCLDHVVAGVWKHAWSHHITRLMVLANWATLLDITPRQITDWFWIAYADAFDWVVEPNVLGMGTFAAANLMSTKPYISGSAYINKMSNYCDECQFDPKKTCPMSHLYWDFLARHQEQLQGNPRMSLTLASQRKRSAEKKKVDRQVFEKIHERLQQGQKVQGSDFEFLNES